ncbi:MAG TPA: hypothetical protein VK167_05560 [Flavipsychrobacter sp.]|nr:hypothetical protein [Chitinophagales bacterium]HLO70313.1 hypothetical protein [Flavipsychrobacter sp.]
MKHIKFLIFAIVFFFAGMATTLAQGPGFDDDVVDEVPLDGGVSALVIAGAAYGAKKLKDMKKK